MFRKNLYAALLSNDIFFVRNHVTITERHSMLRKILPTSLSFHFSFVFVCAFSVVSLRNRNTPCLNIPFSSKNEITHNYVGALVNATMPIRSAKATCVGYRLTETKATTLTPIETN